MAEFAGLSTVLDGAALSTTGGIWPVTTASLNTTGADLVLTAALSYNGGGTGAAVSAPWTLLTAPSATYSLAAAYQSGGAGAYSATWTGNGSPQVPTIILALKSSAGTQ